MVALCHIWRLTVDISWLIGLAVGALILYVGYRYYQKRKADKAAGR